ncbi:MAG: phosphate ABC transporter permease subunit PstC [Akkermansia sp.]|nr:phosphate ABC transporter permease subunit PstC [Akkermansia sp.]
MQRTDAIFKLACLLCACLAGLLMLGVLVQLSGHSLEAWQRFGLGFLWSCEWDPARELFGAWPNIVGTLLTTAVALCLAIPLSFVSALFVTETPGWISRPLSHAVDLLAAIPSVIYGMWGLFVLAPLMQEHVQPALAAIPGTAWLFGEDYNGFGFLTAGLILALMILPYMGAVMRDVLRMTPPMLREAAYGAGCTRLEATRDVVMRYGIRGITGGIFIGMGRALGETMAVLFVIGNIMELPEGLFSGGTTISATLANNFAESRGLEQSSLFALGLILLVMSIGIQAISRYYLHMTSARRGEKH